MGESWGGDKADEHFCCVSVRSHTPTEHLVMYTTTADAIYLDRVVLLFLECSFYTSPIPELLKINH